MHGPRCILLSLVGISGHFSWTIFLFSNTIEGAQVLRPNGNKQDRGNQGAVGWLGGLSVCAFRWDGRKFNLMCGRDARWDDGFGWLVCLMMTRLMQMMMG